VVDPDIGKVQAARSQWLLEPATSLHWKALEKHPQSENDAGAQERAAGVAQITALPAPLSYAATL
jgi:hypothetical protein